MKYYKYVDTYVDPDQVGMTYLETENGGTFRQLTILPDQTISSNVDICLGEGQVDYDLEEDVIPITQQEFEQVWNTHLEKHRTKWDETKKSYPIGSPVTGLIERFFPQGTIINLKDGAIGVADYGQCRASTQEELNGVWYRITGVVQGYDEANQWVIIGSPQVHADRTD